MAKKKVVPAKAKSTTNKSKTVGGKPHAKPVSAAKHGTKSAAKTPAPASAKKAVAPPTSKKSKAPVTRTVIKAVKVAAAPVKPVAKGVQPPKAVEKKIVAPAHPRPAAPTPTAVKPVPVALAAAKVASPGPAAQPVRTVAVAANVAKAINQKVSAPPMGAKPMASAPQPTAAPASAAGQPKKPVSQRHGFKKDEFIVYPAHGVGRIVAIEEQEIAGVSLELFVITFEKDKMTLRVPTGKLVSVGMRKLAEEDVVRKAMETLKGRARIKRTMWSRRAQEYEAKINSGDLVSIAEVVRDLYRSEQQPEQSYSERQLYEAALDRMAREIAAVDKIDERSAVQRITDVLSKSAKGRRLAAEAAEAEAAESEGGVEVKAA